MMQKRIMICQFAMTLCIAYVLCGCGHNEFRTVIRDDGTSFRTSKYELYHKTTDDSVNDILFAGAIGDNTVIVNCVGSNLFIEYIDRDGNEYGSAVMAAGNSNSFCIRNGVLYIVSGNSVYRCDPSDSDPEQIADNLPVDISKVYATDTGFVAATSDAVLVFSDGFELLKSIHTEFEPSYYHPLVIKQDGYYAVEDLFPGINIYRLDLDSESYELVCNGDDIGAEQSSFYGNYYINGNRLMSLDISTRSITVVGDFNNMIVPQPVEMPVRGRGLHTVDDDIFYMSYVYPDGNYEIIRFDHDKDLDYSKREKIRIAGYGTMTDPVLMYAVQEFNSSQDHFFAVVEDYTDNYKYSDAREAQQRKAEIIRRYTSEGAPDIIYGNDNDYGYMGRNGMVIDMYRYLTPDITDNMTGSIKNIMIEPSATYEVFSSYNLNGYWGTSSVWDTNNVSFMDADIKASELNKQLYCQLYDYDIVDMAVRYETEYMIKNAAIPDKEDFKRLLVHAGRYGLSSNDAKTAFDTIEGLADKKYLMARFIDNRPQTLSYMFRTIDDKAVFIGFPSTYGSCHTIEPYGCMAISSDSKNPDACWQLISRIFEDDIQKLASSYEQYPVKDAILEGYLRNSIDQNVYPEDEYVSYIREAIRSADTVITFDWGMFNIFYEELCSMNEDGKEIERVAEIINSRYQVYLKENYG